MKQFLQPAVALALALVFTACGNNKPAESKFKGVWSGPFGFKPTTGDLINPAGTVNITVDGEGKFTGTIVAQTTGTISTGKITESGAFDLSYTYQGNTDVYKLTGSASLSGEGKEFAGDNISNTDGKAVEIGKVNFKLTKK
jgi:hypothetical protein